MKKKKTRKEPRWQKEQKGKRRKLIGQAFVRVLTTLCILVFLFIGFKLWQTFKNSCWDGKHEVNIVVQKDDVTVYSFNPQDKILNILIIPGETYAPAAKGYGEYQIKNIYELGEMEKIGGGTLLLKSIQSFFAIPIDGWIKINKDKPEGISLLPVFLAILKGQAKTNLSWWDLVGLFWQTKNLAVDQINEVDLRNTSFMEKDILSDGRQIFKFEATSIDDLTIKLFADEEVLKEDLQVIVLNGTDHQGLAKDMARVVKNLGAELIGAKDYNSRINQSQIFGQSKTQTQSYTASRIAKSFGMEINKENPDNQEVDLVIILGEDFWRQFYSSE